MKYKLHLLAAMFCCEIIGSKAVAQSDTTQAQFDSDFAACAKKISLHNSRNNLDSAIYYATKLDTVVAARYGYNSLRRANFITGATGLLYTNRQDYHSAYETYKTAASIFRKLNDTLNGNYGKALLGWSKSLINLSGYSGKELEDVLVECRAFFRQAYNGQAYANSTLLYGTMHGQRTNYDEAVKLYDEVEATLDTLPKTPIIYYLYLSLYNNTAPIYEYTGNLKKAIGAMKKAVAIGRIAKSPELPTLLLNLCDYYLQTNHPDSAAFVIKEAEDSLVNSNDAITKAELSKEKGTLYWAQKKWTSAQAATFAYIHTMDSLKIKPSSYNGTLKNLAVLYMKSGDYVLADSIFRSQLQQQSPTGTEDSYDIQQLRSGLAENLVHQKKYAEAADTFLALGNSLISGRNRNFAAMTEEQQLNYNRTFDVIYHVLMQCLANDKNIGRQRITAALDLELQRKSLVLNNWANVLARIKNSGDTITKAAYTAWLQKKNALAKQYALPANNRTMNTDSLEVQVAKLETQFSMNAPTVTLQASGWEKITETQNAGTANIEFVRYVYKTANDLDSACYAAFAFSKGDAAVHFVKLCTEEQLITLMKDKKGNWVDALQLTRNLYETSSEDAVQLCRLIWHPLQIHLKGTTQINYSSAGLLNNIAFNAILNGKNHLSGTYTLRSFSNLNTLCNDASRGNPAPAGIQIWGNMKYGKPTPMLQPNADAARPEYVSAIKNSKASSQLKNISAQPLKDLVATEISDLKKLFTPSKIPVSSYENEKASEETFKRASPAARGILHISTHGFYVPYQSNSKAGSTTVDNITSNTNPLLRCGIAFTGINDYWMSSQPKAGKEDGLLTGYEAAQLNLQQVDLVTLSACETGLGDVTDNEGNLGLVRAFKLAGAKKVLVSLWPVPSKQTSELMMQFYTHWLAGKTPAQALQLAEQAMVAKKYPPFFWAGFVLVE